MLLSLPEEGDQDPGGGGSVEHNVVVIAVVAVVAVEVGDIDDVGDGE